MIRIGEAYRRSQQFVLFLTIQVCLVLVYIWIVNVNEKDLLNSHLIEVPKYKDSRSDKNSSSPLVLKIRNITSITIGNSTKPILVKRIIFQNNIQNETWESEAVFEKTYVDGTNKICKAMSFEKLIKPCKKQMAWSNRELEKCLRTAINSVVIQITVRPLRNISTVKITKTRDMLGREKKYGGDYWRVRLISNKISAHVGMTDNDDGTYSGNFIITNFGKYVLKMALEYSVCDGLIDPPLDWFKKGTVNGKFQASDTLGPNDYFINQKIPDITLRWSEQDQNFAEQSFTRTEKRRKHGEERIRIDAFTQVNNGCGYWKLNSFTPYNKNQLDDKTTATTTERNLTLDTILFFGDSLQVRFFKSLQYKPFCSKLFTKCILKYSWVYLKNSGRYQRSYDHLQFNKTKWLLEVKATILLPELRSNRSVVLINFGLHLVMSLQLNVAMDLFWNFLSLIRELQHTEGVNLPHIIWKETTPSMVENTKYWNVTSFRFLTKQRIEVWNAFTNEEARKAHLPILYVYEMASSFPQGSIDQAHFKDEAFASAESSLMEYLKKRFA